VRKSCFLSKKRCKGYSSHWTSDNYISLTKIGKSAQDHTCSQKSRSRARFFVSLSNNRYSPLQPPLFITPPLRTKPHTDSVRKHQCEALISIAMRCSFQSLLMSLMKVTVCAITATEAVTTIIIVTISKFSFLLYPFYFFTMQRYCQILKGGLSPLLFLAFTLEKVDTRQDPRFTSIVNINKQKRPGQIASGVFSHFSVRANDYLA